MTRAGEFLTSLWSFLPIVVVWVGWATYSTLDLRESRRDLARLGAHVEDMTRRGATELVGEDRDLAHELALREHHRRRRSRVWSAVITLTLCFASARLGATLATP